MKRKFLFSWCYYETSILELTWKLPWNLLWNNPWNYAFVLAHLWNSCFNLKHLQNQHLGIDMKITLKPALKQFIKLCFCLGSALKLMLQPETFMKPASWHWHEYCPETCSETIHKTMLLSWPSFETHASIWNIYKTSILALTWKLLWNLLWNNS